MRFANDHTMLCSINCMESWVIWEAAKDSQLVTRRKILLYKTNVKIYRIQELTHCAEFAVQWPESGAHLFSHSMTIDIQPLISSTIKMHTPTMHQSVHVWCKNTPRYLGGTIPWETCILLWEVWLMVTHYSREGKKTALHTMRGCCIQFTMEDNIFCTSRLFLYEYGNKW